MSLIGFYLCIQRRDIAEILLKLALNTNQLINQSIHVSTLPYVRHISNRDKPLWFVMNYVSINNATQIYQN
jgi:hypothetical protein